MFNCARGIHGAFKKGNVKTVKSFFCCCCKKYLLCEALLFYDIYCKGHSYSCLNITKYQHLLQHERMEEQMLTLMQKIYKLMQNALVWCLISCGGHVESQR